MRLTLLAGPVLALGAFVLIATPELIRDAAAQMPSPPRPGDSRLNQSKPGEAVLPEGAQPQGRDTKGPGKGDGLTTGRDGDKIGATDDDQGRHGEAHSDPTLAVRPAPPSDPAKQ